MDGSQQASVSAWQEVAAPQGGGARRPGGRGTEGGEKAITLADSGLHKEQRRLRPWLRGGEERRAGGKRGQRGGGKLPLKARMSLSTHSG